METQQENPAPCSSRLTLRPGKWELQRSDRWADPGYCSAAVDGSICPELGAPAVVAPTMRMPPAISATPSQRNGGILSARTAEDARITATNCAAAKDCATFSGSECRTQA